MYCKFEFDISKNFMSWESTPGLTWPILYVGVANRHLYIIKCINLIVLRI